MHMGRNYIHQILVCRNLHTVLPLVQCFAIEGLKFLITQEQGTPHVHFVLGPVNYVGGLGIIWISY